MKTTNVCAMVGTGRPRRCATQTASGSIDAAASDAKRILRGVVVVIIEEMRMTIAFHDSGPISIWPADLLAMFSVDTNVALRSMYQRPASTLVCAGPFAYRVGRNARTDTVIALT